MMHIKKCPSVCAALSSGFILRLYFIFSSHYISPDGTQYAGIGYNLLHFFRYQSNGAQFPDIVQPPLYPFFTGLLSWFFPLEYAAKFTSLLFGLLLVYGVYRFALFLKAEKKYAVAAAWLAALHPALVLVSSEAATESLYLLLVLAGVAVGWLYIKKQRLLFIVLSSFIWLAAFLTRAEGIAFFVIQFVIFVFMVWKKQKRLHLLYFLLPFFIGMAVYMQFTAQELGYQTPSPKLKLVRSHARLHNLYKEDLKQLSRSQREWKIKYSLTPAGDELAANALLFKRWETAPPLKTGGSDRSFIVSLFRRIIHNSTIVLLKIKNGFAFPLIFLFFLLLSLPVLFRKTDKNTSAGLEKHFLWYLLIMSAGTFSFLVSHVEDRFLYTLLPFFVFAAAEGFMLGYRFLGKKINGGILKKNSFALFLFLLFMGFVFSYGNIGQKHQAKNYYYRAGIRLQSFVKQQDKIAATMPQAVFYSGAKYSVLPFASLSRLLLYLQEQEALYILLESKDIQRIPAGRKLRDTLPLKTEFSFAGKTFYLLSLNKEH